MCLSIGISKREMLDDYYPGELSEIFAEHNVIHGTRQEEKYEDVSVEDLFASVGGQRWGK